MFSNVFEAPRIDICPGASAYGYWFNSNENGCLASFSVHGYYERGTRPTTYLTITREFPSAEPVFPGRMELFTCGTNGRTNAPRQWVFIELGQGLNSNYSYFSIFTENTADDRIMINGLDIQKAVDELDEAFPELELKSIFGDAISKKQPCYVCGSQKKEVILSRKDFCEKEWKRVVQLIRHYILHGNFSEVA